jgi:hypothetical protein
VGPLDEVLALEFLVEDALFGVRNTHAESEQKGHGKRGEILILS